MTVVEVADYLRVHPITIYRLITSRKPNSLLLDGEFESGRGEHSYRSRVDAGRDHHVRLVANYYSDWLDAGFAQALVGSEYDISQAQAGNRTEANYW
jgi:hypothetical protein